jgi:hypothetical protein
MTGIEQALDLAKQAVAGDSGALLWYTFGDPWVRRFVGRSCAASEVLDAVRGALFMLAKRIGKLRVTVSFHSGECEIVRSGPRTRT